MESLCDGFVGLFRDLLVVQSGGENTHCQAFQENLSGVQQDQF